MILDGAITQNKLRFLQREKESPGVVNRINGRLLTAWSKHDLISHCGQNRRFLWLSKFNCPRFIGTGEGSSCEM